MISIFIAVWQSILRLITAFWGRVHSFFEQPHVRRIASDFCAEVAVLVTVFPVLDVFVEGRRLRDDSPSGVMQAQGAYGVSWRLVLWCVIIVLAFLSGAISLANRVDKDEDRGSTEE